jgi:hypothetical protein
MKRRLLLFAAALAVMGLAASTTQAGPILVSTDSGSIGGFKFLNAGIDASGVATIMVTGLPNTSSAILNVNGPTLGTPEPTTVNEPLTLFVKLTSPEHYSLALSPPTYTQTVGNTPGSQAMLAFDVSAGVAPSVLPKIFNAGGNITSLLANKDPNLDFSNFAAGGTINFTFTGTTFSGGKASFADLFATVGESVIGTGSFSQAAVPEPASIALFGVGMTGFIVFRRLVQKRTKAA